MDIIEKMPDGVDTVIGAKGVYLSGGEQQRIAIARVMLKNSPIIILDEDVYKRQGYANRCISSGKNREGTNCLGTVYLCPQSR